jgi:hypothetical protein
MLSIESSQTSNLKMNKDNMKSLFNSDHAIGPFLTQITESTSTCTSEIAHLDIITLFAQDKFDIEHMNVYLEKYKDTFCATDKFINKILDVIIEDYNNKYIQNII